MSEVSSDFEILRLSAFPFDDLHPSLQLEPETPLLLSDVAPPVGANLVTFSPSRRPFPSGRPSTSTMDHVSSAPVQSTIQFDDGSTPPHKPSRVSLTRSPTQLLSSLSSRSSRRPSLSFLDTVLDTDSLPTAFSDDLSMLPKKPNPLPMSEATALLEEDLLRLDPAPGLLLRLDSVEGLDDALKVAVEEDRSQIGEEAGRLGFGEGKAIIEENTKTRTEDDRFPFEVHDEIHSPTSSSLSSLSPPLLPTVESLRRQITTLELSVRRATERLTSLQSAHSMLLSSLSSERRQVDILTTRLDNLKELRWFRDLLSRVRPEDQKEQIYSLRTKLLQTRETECEELESKRTALVLERDSIRSKQESRLGLEDERVNGLRQRLTALNLKLGELYSLAATREKACWSLQRRVDENEKKDVSTNSFESESERQKLVSVKSRRTMLESAMDEVGEVDLEEEKQANLQLRNAVKNQKQQLHKAERLILSLRQKLQSLHEKSEVQTRKMNDLVSALNASREETRRIRRGNEHNLLQSSKKKKKKEALQQQQLTHIKRLNQRLSERIEQLEVLIRESKANHAVQLQQIEEAKKAHVRNIIKQFAGRTSSLQRERDDAVASVERMRTVSNQRIEELNGRLVQEDQKRIEVERQIADQQSKQRQLSESLHEHRNRCVVLSDDLRQEQQQTKTLRSELTRLQSDFQRLKRERDEERRVHEENQQKIQLYIGRVQTRKKRHDFDLRRLEGKVRQLEGMASEKDRQIAALSNQVRILRSE